ncbi:MAG: tRNA pseudouridine(55) synthase TruB [Chloroflexi bacterium]|nr:tRNA pseudouridine(55) synthase TruB [Chloroflexota bacterium]
MMKKNRQEKRDKIPYFGFINLKKSPGKTSHDCVNIIRCLFGTKKVGHLGTLDPLASGVLPVAIGRATRLIGYVRKEPKIYRAEFILGITTDTDDLEGEILKKADVPDFAESLILLTLEQFKGKIMQRPPLFSAVHHNGRRLYQLARRGESVEPETRAVELFRIELLRWEKPKIELEIECGSGFYVRSLARDVGEKLGCGACLASLERTRSGPFSIEDSYSVEDLAGMEDGEELEKAVISPEDILKNLPSVIVDKAGEDALAYGIRISAPENFNVPEGEAVMLLNESNKILAVGKINTDEIAPLRVFVEPYKRGDF